MSATEKTQRDPSATPKMMPTREQPKSRRKERTAPHHVDHCPQPAGPRQRIKQFCLDVFNNVAVRVITLIVTGVMISMGWINAAIIFIVQMFTRLFS